MQECAKRIAKVLAEAKLEIYEDTYLSSLNPHPMDMVCTWATGATSVHICRTTAVAEGSTIRWTRHLGRTASTDVSSSKSRWKRGAGEQICWRSHQNQEGYCICCQPLLTEFNINHHLSVWSQLTTNAYTCSSGSPISRVGSSILLHLNRLSF